MKKLSAQKGFIGGAPLIIGGAIVAIIIILYLTGSLKFSGYVKVDDSKKSQDNQTTTQNVESTPTEKPKPAVKLNSESFTDTKYGYSISYPEGWKVKEETNNVTIYKPSETKGANKPDALVIVGAVNIGDYKETKLATIGDLNKTVIKKQFNDVEFIGEKEIKVNGQDGFELEFTGTIGTEKIHGRYIVVKGDEYLFPIIGSSNTGLWDGEKDNIEASIQTFKIN